MKIRFASQADFDFILSGRLEIARLEKSKIINMVWERKRVRGAIAQKRIRVAAHNSQQLGFLWFVKGSSFPFGVDYGPFGKTYYWIDYVFVIKEARGKGVGTALYKDILSLARQRKIKKILCDVYTVNKAAEKFHKSLGFKPFATIYGR